MLFGLREQYLGAFSYYLNAFSFTSKERDRLKRLLCAKAGITLVEIPYWWNMSEASIRATLARIRPDLNIVVPIGAEAISETKLVTTERDVES